MRFAYADPPYIGQARKHYSRDPRCAEVDHEELLARLVEYDGWALSCSSPSLAYHGERIACLAEIKRLGISVADDASRAAPSVTPEGDAK